MISFRIDWFDLLAVQEILKNLLQHHSWKASILRRSAFFIVGLSHPYMTTGKTKALTRRIFVGKVMSLLFNTLSRLVIGEGNGNPLHCSCLENSRDGGAWWAAIYGVTQSQTRLSDWAELKKWIFIFEDYGIWSHHFMGNRWGNSGNSVRFYFEGAQKSLQMVTAAMKLKDA